MTEIHYLFHSFLWYVFSLICHGFFLFRTLELYSLSSNPFLQKNFDLFCLGFGRPKKLTFLKLWASNFI